MVMPFGHEDLQVVYEEFIKPALERKCHVTCIRGDDIFGSNVVMDDVSAAISSADLVVADLTGKNANVFYEVESATPSASQFFCSHRRWTTFRSTFDIDVSCCTSTRHLVLSTSTSIVEHVKDMLNQWHED